MVTEAFVPNGVAVSYGMVVNDEGKRAWIVCGDFNKGVVVVVEMLHRCGLSMAKV